MKSISSRQDCQSGPRTADRRRRRVLSWAMPTRSKLAAADREPEDCRGEVRLHL